MHSEVCWLKAIAAQSLRPPHRPMHSVGLVGGWDREITATVLSSQTLLGAITDVDRPEQLPIFMMMAIANTNAIEKLGNRGFDCISLVA